MSGAERVARLRASRKAPTARRSVCDHRLAPVLSGLGAPLLDPMPVRTESEQFPKPTRILSKANLFAAWRGSRDSTSDPGRPGIDGITAEQFALRIDERLATLAADLRSGKYHPSRLKPVFIPKPNSDKDRLICIPVIRDRVVQKAIVNYLVTKDKLPIENEFSFGFIAGKGTSNALDRALDLRRKYDWCLKTDIEAFFDRITRSEAKTRVTKALRNSSLTPLIHSFIDCEIRETKFTRPKLVKQEIMRGRGLRQGMPLSPLLANLVLSDFDASFRAQKIEMVRYADDLLLFFHSKRATQDGFEFVRSRLAEQGLTIPELGDESSKTQIVAPRQPVTFLGLELVYLESTGRYEKRVGRRQIAKIERRLEEQYSFENLRKERVNFQQANVDLWRSISSYLSIYRGTYDFPTVDSELRRIARKVIEGLFEDVFGADILKRVTPEGREFLGLGKIEIPEGADGYEV
ncbi:group II intron reverse transcriptase/maturase [Bradyrhizobium elkanii]|uniref:reverse transcriptase domain-containing protein n=1 Tax=Bradyrhizobium TaxID=374 RepID=UPI002169105C|nr:MULTISPECIES: reverse transcriptase domain-containing protein [Bradyrhizobium]MCS3928103.1 group II intron reverse transcriptase/maturase [Bradyrhizobium elkanii]MCS3968657.1 group II intron reverse transcriptase/maturase [Bradyrhizobium japonicum]